MTASAQEQVVYSRLTDGYWQIWMINEDGSEPTQLTTSKRDKRSPVCIDSTQQVVYRSNNGKLYQYSLENGQETELLSRYNSINSPDYCDGIQKLLFVRFNPREIDISDIWVSDMTGDETRMVTQDKYLKYHPSFSPTCDQVAFVSADGQLEHNIWTISPESKERVQITKADGLDVHPRFTPDGANIIFASNRDGQDYEIYVVNVESKKVKSITNNEDLDTTPDVAADSQRVVFTSTRSGVQQLWLMDLDGSNVKQLTDGTSEAIEPRWCAAGEK